MIDQVRIIHVGDQHLDTVAPSSRKDDYWEAICEKLLEVKAIAHERKVNAVVYSGDWTNKQDGHRVPYKLTNWSVNYFSHFNDGADEPIGTFMVLGNHDVKARVDLWPDQPIGNIVIHGKVTPLWTSPTEINPTGYVTHPVKWGRHGGSTFVRLHGRLFSYKADTEEMRSVYYSVERSVDTFEIACMHTEMIPNGDKQLFDYTTPEMVDAVVIPEKRPDIYLCGHVHECLSTFEGTGYRCVNYGALSRGSIDEYNLQRTVQVALIEITREEQSGVVKYHAKVSGIPIKCAKPSSEAFYTKELEKKRFSQNQLAQLAETLKMSNIRDTFRVVNPDDAIDLLLKSQNVDPSIEARVRAYVAQAKQELGL